MIMAPIVLFIIVFGNKLLAIFGPEYSVAAYPMLQLLAISSLFSAVREKWSYEK